jgi:hypothetical protein
LLIGTSAEIISLIKQTLKEKAMIKKLIPVFIAVSGAVILTIVINRYLAKLGTDSIMRKIEDKSSDEINAEAAPEKTFEERRRKGFEDRRKELRDLAMSRPRRKDEMIH